jgi:hypothetical protein
MPIRPRVALVLVLAVYLLSHLSQIAITPLGEGMDFFGHLSYVVFAAENGRSPSADEPSVPAWIAALKPILPAPDASADGSRYREWAHSEGGARQARRAAALAVPDRSEYVAANYEAQQPGLSYWLASRVYLRLDPGWDLARRVYALSAFSECLVAIGLVAVWLTFRLYVDEAASALALLAVAWYPNLLAFFGRLTNDSLAFALMAWAIFLTCRSQRRDFWRDLVAAGGLLVLAAFTKAYALTFVPVYLLCALRPAGRTSWRRLAVAAAIVIGGVGWLFERNLRTSGRLLPLLELRLPREAAFSEILQSALRIDPAWFMAGMARGFWWSGYWSFLSPGAFYYLPPLALGYLLFKRPVDVSAGSHFLSFREIWPHVCALGFFLAGMVWHAAAFRFYAELGGAGVRRGNEGWYANALLGSAFVIGLVLLKHRVPAARFRSVLAGTAVFLIIWNLVARAALVGFWTGRAVKPRGFGFETLRPAGGPAASLWSDLESLPGILGPLPLTCALPLAIALAVSAFLVLRLRRAS